MAGRNKGKGKHHDESLGGADPGCARPNSFDPNTLVLMGDGSRKPIKDVKVGDKVLAKDPTTGRSAVRVVTDVRSHASARTLVEVGVVSGADCGSVVATDEHPFWVESEKRWSHAVDLKAGHRLETGDHRDATVTGTRSWSETRRVYNLTVDADHTYYVIAGQTPVLTHNCGGSIDPTLVRFSQDSASPRFSSGETVEQTAAALRSGYIKAEDLPLVRLTVRDGQVYSLDNRRLVAFQKAGIPMPFRMASPEEALEEAWKFSTKNEGKSITVRYFDPVEWTP